MLFIRCMPKIGPHPRNLFEDVSAETSVQYFPRDLVSVYVIKQYV